MTGKQQKSLDQLEVGQEAIVQELSEPSEELRRRLLSLGLVHGVKVAIKCLAPLGDPIAVQLLNFIISLRRAEARQIIVLPL